MIVHKFGGTSVGDADCIAGVTDIVAEQHKQQELVVVVSAMAGVTDQLITGALAAATGNEPVYRQTAADLQHRHLQVVESLLDDGQQRHELSALIQEQLLNLERFYTSIAVLGELTARSTDAVAYFGEQLRSEEHTSELQSH